jgi:hypothetical protein
MTTWCQRALAPSNGRRYDTEPYRINGMYGTGCTGPVTVPSVPQMGILTAVHYTGRSCIQLDKNGCKPSVYGHMAQWLT